MIFYFIFKIGDKNGKSLNNYHTNEINLNSI